MTVHGRLQPCSALSAQDLKHLAWPIQKDQLPCTNFVPHPSWIVSEVACSEAWHALARLPDALGCNRRIRIRHADNCYLKSTVRWWRYDHLHIPNTYIVAVLRHTSSSGFDR